MKRIPLTKGQYALVDDEDYDYLMQWKWQAHKGVTYAIRSELRNGKRVTVHMHRLVINAPDGMQVDHIDRNGLNNQKANLRLCDNQHNCMNTPSRKGSSRFKGVTRKVVYGLVRYASQIQIKGRKFSIGIYSEEDIAAMAYDIVAKMWFGEFAWLNFPDMTTYPPNISINKRLLS